MCRDVWWYQDGYVDGVEATLSVVSDYLTEDIINHIKRKIDYYESWKGNQ